MRALMSWYHKLLIAVPAEGAAIKCMYMYVAVLHPSALMLWKMERTSSLQPTLTLIYVGVHSVYDSNCKLQISSHRNGRCESMFLV